MDNELKEFWEWCGFKLGIPSSDGGFYINYPDGACERNYPELTLDNLFKYAVPKVSRLYIYVPTNNAPTRVRINGKYSAEDKDPTQALYKAIQKVITY